MLEPGDPRHGTLNGYKGLGCRCDVCLRAVSAHHAKHQDASREMLRSAKDKPCADCGGRFPTVCMEFDHRDPAEKLFVVASGLLRSHRALRAEMAKCDVVCSNCHRVRTAQQRSDGTIKVGRPRKVA